MKLNVGLWIGSTLALLLLFAFKSLGPQYLFDVGPRRSALFPMILLDHIDWFFVLMVIATSLLVIAHALRKKSGK